MHEKNILMPLFYKKYFIEWHNGSLGPRMPFKGSQYKWIKFFFKPKTASHTIIHIEVASDLSPRSYSLLDKMTKKVPNKKKIIVMTHVIYWTFLVISII